jgi:transaldolase
VLWASTGTKDPLAPDTLYVESLATPYSVNTMPEKTLLAFADHGKLGRPLVEDFERAVQTLDFHRDCGLEIDALGTKLQTDGAASFVESWKELMGRIEEKTKG